MAEFISSGYFTTLQTVYFFLLFLSFFFVLVRSVQLSRSRGYSALILALDFFVFVLLQLILADKNPFSAAALFALSLAFTAALALFTNDLIKFRKRYLTAMSVKEACDRLSNGLCYYYSDGKILLVNETMNEISNAVTGYDAINGALLSEKLKAVSDGGVLKADSGHIYYLTDNKIEMNGETLTELIAADVTAEYRLNDELSEKNRQLETRREHLLNYSRLVEEYTIEKETLQAKLSIHDNLGALLLATKQYIKNSEVFDGDIDSMWEVNLSLLRNNGNPHEEESFESIIKAAGELGLRVCVIGTLPEDESLNKTICYALRECVTNAVRHAEASELTLVITDSGISLTNNGKRPDGEITEKGGLANLRRFAEDGSWKMEIKSVPEFELDLYYPER